MRDTTRKHEGYNTGLHLPNWGGIANRSPSAVLSDSSWADRHSTTPGRSFARPAAPWITVPCHQRFLRPRNRLRKRRTFSSGRRRRHSSSCPGSSWKSAKGAHGELVPLAVQVAKVVGEADQEAKLLDAKIGPGQGRLTPPGVGRFDERFQHIESGTLDAVPEQEALRAGKPVESRDQPEDELVVALDGGAGDARSVAAGSRRLSLAGGRRLRLAVLRQFPLGGLRRLRLSSLRPVRFGGAQAFIRYSGQMRNRRPNWSRLAATRGRRPLDPRKRGKEVKNQVSIYCPGQTEPVAEAPVPGRVPDAERRAEAARRAAPGAAAQHTLGTISACPRAPVGRSARVTLVPAIVRPFPYVAQHIMQAERVRPETAHGCGPPCISVRAITPFNAVEAINKQIFGIPVRVRTLVLLAFSPSTISSASPPAPHTPTPLRSADGIPVPSPSTTNSHTPARPPSSR